MSDRWVGNDVWQQKEFHNRAPRPGLTVCQRPPLWWRWRAPLVLVGCAIAGSTVGYLAVNCFCH